MDENRLRDELRTSLFGERRSQLDSLGVFAINPMVGVSSIVGTPALGTPWRHPIAWMLRPMYTLDLCQTLDVTTQVLRASESGSYAQAAGLTPTSAVPRWGPERVTRMLSDIMAPSLERVPYFYLRSLAASRMAAIALVLRLCELDHGAWPESLDALVPDYLPILPADPFATNGRTFGFLPDARAPRLYSISTDGVDDAGAYQVSPSGDVDRDSKDWPFFLRGDRPGPAD